MTAREVYRLALALMAQREAGAAELEAQAPALLDMMLCELFALNEALRAGKGLAPLPAPGRCVSLNDTLPYEQELLRGALPYGLAAKLMLEEDLSRAAYFNNEYIEKKYWFARAQARSIQNLY